MYSSRSPYTSKCIDIPTETYQAAVCKSRKLQLTSASADHWKTWGQRGFSHGKGYKNNSICRHTDIYIYVYIPLYLHMHTCIYMYIDISLCTLFGQDCYRKFQFTSKMSKYQLLPNHWHIPILKLLFSYLSSQRALSVPWGTQMPLTVR